MFIPEELYSRILKSMPIPCVDLLVFDTSGRLLLLKRVSEPAKGLWWLPGGRVLFNETRAQAAVRKLQQECGLTMDRGPAVEVGTEDFFLPDGKGGISHTIATLFCIEIGDTSGLVVDEQSLAADWRLPAEWLNENLDTTMQRIIKQRILASPHGVNVERTGEPWKA